MSQRRKTEFEEKEPVSTRVVRKVLGVTSSGLDENHELFCIVLSDPLEVNSSSFSPP